MANRIVFPPKRQSETAFLPPNGFNFLSSLGPTETISTAVCSATVYTGVDPTPNAIVSGSAAISGTVVTQLFTAGVVGVIYDVVCSITTSLGQTLKLAGYLAVIPDLP